MLEKTLSPGQVARYFEGLLPRADTERKRHNRLATRALLMRNFENEKNTLPGMKHTAWAAYNAVSEWADHQRQFRSSRDSQKFRDVDRGRAESRLHSVWFGSSHHLKQKAYRQAVELAALN